jgi:hypothetical protein
MSKKSIMNRSPERLFRMKLSPHMVLAGGFIVRLVGVYAVS